MSRPFKDHFSGHARDYAAHRPHYPAALFEWLSGLTPTHDLAWDAGTGNGQAARALAAHFVHVVATDASAEQIASAIPHARLEYRVAPAEDSQLPAGSADLVTCAQALHWFDIDAFTGEVVRILRSGGVFAAWCYGLFSVDPQVDPALSVFHTLVAPYWPPERKLIDEGYRSIAFPFEELRPPRFEMAVEWTAEQTVAYLMSWSAVRRYLAAERDPANLEQASRRIVAVWGEGTRHVRWPLHMRVGRR